jgi:8-oxo-dGTP pyrophosphatase MutT (NUDIX family)
MTAAFLEELGAALARRAPNEVNDPGLRWAAVAVIVAPVPPSLLLIRRAERTGDPWSGQVALPGGHHQRGDHDLIETAMRETMEEVGLTLDRSQLLGALDDVAPRTPVLPPIVVRPFVFGLETAALPVMLSNEVASAHWEPIADLLRDDARGEFAFASGGVERRLPSYRTSAGTLWGMTERILDGLLEMMKAGRRLDG